MKSGGGLSEFSMGKLALGYNFKIGYIRSSFLGGESYNFKIQGDSKAMLFARLVE